MEQFDKQNHWENIYSTKELKEVSWYQPIPQTSLDFIASFSVNKNSSIIDVGGGDSLLVDHLLQRGYTNLSVLDISGKAIERAKARLGEQANKVKWIVCDASNFEPTEQYDIWHDRAAFHFLTSEEDISEYLLGAQMGLRSSGIMILGTFSESGPKKCSGIEIKQYSEQSMVERVKDNFEKIKCITVDHKTPSDKNQNFVFCGFRKR